MNEETFIPTNRKPVSNLSKNYEKNFNKTMTQGNIKLNETDELLTEKEQSVKRKIFSLPKMEALAFSDPKLTAVYDSMAENGSERYGYHYNETILNLIFNDYVLNSEKYLQKYKMAIPKISKRRDKSGINQLKKAGEISMNKTGTNIKKQPMDENEEPLTKVDFLVNETDPENSDVFAYFPEEKHDEKYNMSYSHIGQHSACDPEYAKESREATPEEYMDLKRELDGIGYNLDVLNTTNETTGAASSGAFSAPMGFENKVDETTSAGSAGGAAGYVGYAGPAAWGGGDLMKGGKSKVMRKPIWQGGTIIGESKTNYLVDPIGFEKYVQTLNEQIEIEEPQLSQKNNIPADTNKRVNDYLIDKTNAFTSNGIKKWGKGDTNLELKTVKSGIMDKPELKVEGIGDTNKITTVEQLKELKLTAEMIPQLADKALYAVAIRIADKMLYPMSWDELPDINSMWSYINPNGGMTVDRLKDAVKRAVKKRVKEAGYDNLFESDINEKAKSKSQQRFMGIVHAVQKGELNPNKVGGAVEKAAKTMKEKDVEDFAKTNTKKLPEKINNTTIKEETQTMIQSNGTSMSNKMTPTGDQSSGINMGLTTAPMSTNESENLFEELNNELKAYSIHQEKLKKMSEDRKPSALILRDRVGSENEKNFKSDMQHSGTKDIIDTEKQLMWKDQQTNVGENPQKLGTDIEDKEIEVTEGEALKNVGDSANNNGDEIQKRNMTTEEQNEVNNYRLGLGDLVYDNPVGKKFEDRMKKDMGDKLYKQRQDKLKFRGKAPMYNKDPQPIEDTTAKKVQFDKEQSGWNERNGLKESMITGRYSDLLNKRRLIDFTMNEVKLIDSENENLFELDFTGLGNNYNSKTIDNKVSVNEGVVNVLGTHKFFTNGKNVFAVKNPIKKLNENEDKSGKPIVNEQINKMKHLLGYNADTFINTNSVKKNRGF